jgi:hypothetical protein
VDAEVNTDEDGGNCSSSLLFPHSLPLILSSLLLAADPSVSLSDGSVINLGEEGGEDGEEGGEDYEEDYLNEINEDEAERRLEAAAEEDLEEENKQQTNSSHSSSNSSSRRYK